MSGHSYIGNTVDMFKALEHTWLVDEYPVHLRFLDALEILPAELPVENYQVVPRMFAGKLEWAHVGHNPAAQDRTCQFLFVYKHPHIFPNSPPNVLHPVGVRVQGFIEACNLCPLGNWTG